MNEYILKEELEEELNKMMKRATSEQLNVLFTVMDIVESLPTKSEIAEMELC